jgi:hypothetical protein
MTRRSKPLRTAVLLLKAASPTSRHPTAEGVYQVTRFLHEHELVVCFESPNFLKVCGLDHALFPALARLAGSSAIPPGSYVAETIVCP